MTARLPSDRPPPMVRPTMVAAAVVATAATAALVLAGCGSQVAPEGTGMSGNGGQPAAAGSAAASSGVGGAGSGTAGSGSASSGGSQPAGSASSTSATPACAASGLRVWLDTAAAGVAAGSSYVPLEFTNDTRHACQLTGYPAVALTTGINGQQIGTEAAVDTSVHAAAVLLAPGGIAHAWLQVQSTADFPASKCHPVTAAGLRVVAPGSQSASYLAHPVAACKGVIQGGTTLTVHPVQEGPPRRGTA